MAKIVPSGDCYLFMARAASIERIVCAHDVVSHSRDIFEADIIDVC
jgi:hypothetical protein